MFIVIAGGLLLRQKLFIEKYPFINNPAVSIDEYDSTLETLEELSDKHNIPIKDLNTYISTYVGYKGLNKDELDNDLKHIDTNRVKQHFDSLKIVESITYLNKVKAIYDKIEYREH